MKRTPTSRGGAFALGRPMVTPRPNAGGGISGGGNGAPYELTPIDDAQVLANTSGGEASPVGTGVSALLDYVFGSSQGAVLYRDSAAWKMLAPGTSGQVLTTQGADADPEWADGGGAALEVTDGATSVSAVTEISFSGATVSSGGSGIADVAIAAGASGADPTATAGPAAIDGTSSDFMRADAAPAVQLATTGQAGLVEPDGETIGILDGVISARATTTIGPPFHPGMVAGRYYTHPLISTLIGSTGIAANTIYAHLFYVPAETTFTKIGVYVQSVSSGKFIELGIYANNNGVPGALILDAGEVTAGTGGAQQISISQTLNPGWYWLVMASSGTPNVSSGTTESLTLLGAGTISGTLGYNVTVPWTYSTGALPPSFGTPTYTSGVALLVWLGV